MKKLITTIPKNASEHVRVEISEFNGFDLLAIRVYADNGDSWVPTRKGITVRVDVLPALITALAEAERAAQAAGLLPDGDGS